MTGQTPFFEEITVGMALPELTKTPTSTMLFRFSAVTWNAHRIHYDAAYAQHEGHDGILVQATMHGAFLLQMVKRFAGPNGQVLDFEYSNRGKAVPGDILTLGGRVTDLVAAHATIGCEIWERNQDGGNCAIGAARIRLPQRRTVR